MLDQWIWKMTSHVAKFSLKEMFAFFFKKKICKNCGWKLIRTTEKESKGSGWHEVTTGSYNFGPQYIYTFFYRCENCNKLYRLDDL